MSRCTWINEMQEHDSEGTAPHGRTGPGRRDKKSLVRLAVSTALLGLAAAPAVVLAQDQSKTQEPTGVLQEITVTATRVETEASKTPVALSVLSGSQLTEAQISDTARLSDIVPNVYMSPWAGGVQVTIRGITNSDPTERGDPAAGFLIDDVYIARPNGVDNSLFDINRIEVMRGPQGTLFGRNTTAGAIDVITNRPVFQTEGSIAAGVGNYGAYQGTLIFNTPISDTFAIRAGINYRQRDTYLTTGPNVTAKLSPHTEDFSARLQGLKTWDSGSLLLRGEYSKVGGHYLEYVPSNNFYVAYPANGTDAVYADNSTSDILKVNYPATWPMPRDNKITSVGLELKQQLGANWDLTYIGAYRKLDRDEDEPRPDDVGARLFRINWLGTYDQTSHELRFSTTQGRLQLQLGGYYLYEDIKQDLKLVLASGTDGNTPPGTTIWWHTPKLENKSYAGFGQGTFDITDALHLTLGARYSNDTKTRNNAFQVFCAEFDCTTETSARSSYFADDSWSKTTWKFGLDYDLSDGLMTYISISTGYKAGGFNDGCVVGTQPNCGFTADALYYTPETITSYEIGAKGLMFNDMFRFNLALYHFQYDDMQLSAIKNDCLGPNTTSCTVTTNAAVAKSDGLEFESTLAVTDNDIFTIDGTWTDARFTDYVAPARDFSGEPLSYSPDWTLTLGYMHDFHLANDGHIEASLRSKFSDKYYFVDAGGGSLFVQPSYSRTNASVTYRTSDDSWYVQAYVNNIENDLQVTNVIFGPTRRAASFSSPRTYGVQGGWKF